MLGRGYLDFHPTSFQLTSSTYCAPCSRIAFSKELSQNKAFFQITQAEMYEYENSHFIPDDDIKMTYFTFLTNGATYDKNIKINDSYFLNLDEQYTIVSAMDKVGMGKTALFALGGAVLYGVSAYFTLGISTVVLGGVGATAGAFGFLNTEFNANFMSPTILPYDKGTFDRLKCEDIDFKS